jgi:hypothetical protein
MNSDKIKISSDALVSANILKNNNLQKRHLKEEITNIIKRISEELVIAHREGKHDVITTIPITFSIANMLNRDSQRVIYSSVIDELINKNYRTWINIKNDVCKIKITWMSPDDELEIKYQTNLIAKHTCDI